MNILRNKYFFLLLSKMVGVASGLVASSVNAATTSTEYDWSHGGNQGLLGWTNIPDNIQPQYVDVGDRVRAINVDTGNNIEFNDSPHKTLVLASPEFKIGGPNVTEIQFNLFSGVGSGTLVSDVSSLPEDSSNTGFLGMALMRVSDGTYLLHEHKGATGASSEDFTWNEAALSGATAGHSSDETYRLHLIDHYHGGWGHVQTNKVTLISRNVPEPDSYALFMGLLGLTYFIFRRRQR